MVEDQEYEAPSPHKRGRKRYRFRAVSKLTGEVHFEGSQPDLNRFLAAVRNGKATRPVVFEELKVERFLR